MGEELANEGSVPDLHPPTASPSDMISRPTHEKEEVLRGEPPRERLLACKKTLGGKHSPSTKAVLKTGCLEADLAQSTI